MHSYIQAARGQCKFDYCDISFSIVNHDPNQQSNFNFTQFKKNCAKENFNIILSIYDTDFYKEDFVH